MLCMLLNKREAVVIVLKSRVRMSQVDTSTYYKCVDVKCHFLWRAHSTEQTSFTRLSPPGTHLSAESTEAMQIVSCSRTRHTDVTGVSTVDLCIQKPTSHPHDQHATNFLFVLIIGPFKYNLCFFPHFNTICELWFSKKCVHSIDYFGF